MTDYPKPFSLARWIDDHADMLKPPVSNQQVYEDADLIVMIVGGGNSRTDYHDDPLEEFFYQLKGDMNLRIMDRPGEPPRDMQICEGDIYLLPAHLRHSPQRLDPESIGLVVEYSRPPGSLDGFEWFCHQCHALLHRTEVQLDSIVDDLPPLFEAFYGSVEARTCGGCGSLHPTPGSVPENDMP